MLPLYPTVSPSLESQLIRSDSCFNCGNKRNTGVYVNLESPHPLTAKLTGGTERILLRHVRFQPNSNERMSSHRVHLHQAELGGRRYQATSVGRLGHFQNNTEATAASLLALLLLRVFIGGWRTVGALQWRRARSCLQLRLFALEYSKR